MNKQEFLAMSIFTELKYLDDNKKIVDLHCIDNGTGLVNFGWGDAKGVDEVFPILHPLSDLIKEIQHKGEKFVPSMILCDLWIDYGKTKQGADSTQQMFYRWFSGIEIDAYPFYLVQKLIEWHFDIADLISKGEAIDVNTLEANPYK